jgi:hypothetical protein
MAELQEQELHLLQTEHVGIGIVLLAAGLG